MRNKKENEKEIERILLSEYNHYYRMALSYVQKEEDAADIVQSGAYKAIWKSDSLRQIAYAKTWVYRIMMNEIFTFLRKNKKNVSLEELIEKDKQPETFGKNDRYENMDLKKALLELCPQDRAILQLKYMEGYSLEEIAQILGKNTNSIKSRVYRSLKKLKIELEE